MKNNQPTITLLGSNSGNNVGDAAILSAILQVVTDELPTAQFLVPTTNPAFVNKEYGSKYAVKAMDIMPWNFSFRFLGLPSIKCLWKSDVALICDGIIFGKNFYNPAFNLLITLAPLAIFAKLFSCKLVCYSVGIGPFPKGRGMLFARFLIQSCGLIMMREAESKALAQKIGVTKSIELTGDAAYINPVSSDKRAREIAQSEGIDLSRPLLGINITKYVDSWMNDSGQQADASSLVSKIAQGVLDGQKQTNNAFLPVLFSTHPMDVDIAKELATLVKAPLISSTKYLSHDLQSVMRLCSLFIGMRFHSLVLSSAVEVPVVGLIYAPKVRGLMHDLKSSEFALELSTLSGESLAGTLADAWAKKDELKKTQQQVVNQFKEGAYRAARLLATKFFPEIAKVEQQQFSRSAND